MSVRRLLTSFLPHQVDACMPMKISHLDCELHRQKMQHWLYCRDAGAQTASLTAGHEGHTEEDSRIQLPRTARRQACAYSRGSTCVGTDGGQDGGACRRMRFATCFRCLWALLHIDIASSDRAYVFRTRSAPASSSERWAPSQASVTGKVSRPVDRPAGGVATPLPQQRMVKIGGRRRRREGQGLPARDGSRCCGERGTASEHGGQAGRLRLPPRARLGLGSWR